MRHKESELLQACEQLVKAIKGKWIPIPSEELDNAIACAEKAIDKERKHETRKRIAA